MALFSHSAARDWNDLGYDTPYYGVISSDEFLRDGLTQESKDRFFESGQNHVAQLTQKIREIFGAMPMGAALDLGCGVGRVTQALSPLFERVVGLDISQRMLAEAERNAEIAGLCNISYRHALPGERLAPNSYDLIHSYIFLRHDPITDGETIFGALVRSLKPGGIGAIYLAIKPANASVGLAIRNFVKRSRILRPIGNLYFGRPLGSSAMEMNAYRPERLLEILHDNGIDQYTVVRVDDPGSLGVFIFMKRPSDTISASPWSNPRMA